MLPWLVSLILLVAAGDEACEKVPFFGESGAGEEQEAEMKRSRAKWRGKDLMLGK